MEWARGLPFSRVSARVSQAGECQRKARLLSAAGETSEALALPATYHDIIPRFFRKKTCVKMPNASGKSYGGKLYAG